MNSDDFNHLIGSFIAETQDFLQSLEANLLAMEDARSGEARLELIEEMFRAAHSIKGSALMFGMTNLATAAHDLEDCFAILRDRSDLSVLVPATVSALLQGIDLLRIIADESIKGGETSSTKSLEAIAQIAAQIKVQYGHQKEKAKWVSNNTAANTGVIKVIFENELPPVFDRLETELSLSQSHITDNTIAALNEVYYQLSGLAGMLQLSEFGQIAEHLRALIDTPALSGEQLQQHGWAIAQNLQAARDQVLQELPIVIQPFELSQVPSAAENGHGQIGASHEKGTGESVEDSPLHPSTPTPHQYPSTPAPSLASPTIRVDLERLSELVNLVGELVINRTNLEVQEIQLKAEVKRLRRNIRSLNQFAVQLREEYDRFAVGSGEGDVRRAFWGMGTINPVTRRPIPDAQSPLSERLNLTFDNLELDRYNEFHSTAQEVIETTGAIAHSASKIDDLSIKFERSTEQLRRVTDQLRSRVMQLRVVNFSRCVDHLPRAVRELCLTHDKEVNLLLIGRDTRLDETLLEALRDPLVHLVRNAFDHGIELPALRKAAGKPASGQIEIEARHQGGQTIITVTDDGRGIDPEAIRRRVVANGLIAAEQAQDLSIGELYEFLFWPGFSTASEVTELSGRGVGLDVVRTNLRQVRGTIKVDSRIGKGTSFILKLPLMLSIADALLVQVDRNTLAVPLDAVEEILHVRSHQIQMAGNQPMLHWREEYIRLLRLQDLLEYSVPHQDSTSPASLGLGQDYMPVLVLLTSEGIVAIAVERLLGSQEIVVKPLPAPLSKPRGVIGCSLLGDGQVVSILDVDDLCSPTHPDRSTLVRIAEQNSLGGQQTLLLQPPPLSQPQILVVDDSYTIRQLLSLTLTRARYRVVAAKDGQDALEQLQKGLNCDLAIVDIEMPRMDGFELLRSLKSTPTLAKIPVAMLTSRSGAKHRQTAMELGAVQYFTKPYNEQHLLETIAKLVSANS